MKPGCRNSCPSLILCLGLVAFVALGSGPVWGQSGSRRSRPVERKAPPRPKAEQPTPQEEKPAPPPRIDAEATAAKTRGSHLQLRPAVAAEGYDLVTLIGSDELVAGSPEHEALFDGQTYRFASPENLAEFVAKPASYAPVFGGFSVVLFRDRNELKQGSVQHYTNYGSRIYFFTNAEEKTRFDSAPSGYVDADVLMDGFSPVSLVNDEVLRRGDKQFMTIHDGRRVFLTNEEELEQFEQDNGRFYPTLGGLDPVAAVKGAPAIGLARFAAVYKNRLYMMSSEDNRKEFLDNPLPYSDLDVALNGTCPVTSVEENRETRGHYGISVVYRGGRLLFAGEQKQQRFLESPKMYDLLPK